MSTNKPAVADGVHGHVQKSCTDQLTPIFTNIFDLQDLICSSYQLNLGVKLKENIKRSVYTKVLDHYTLPRIAPMLLGIEVCEILREGWTPVFQKYFPMWYFNDNGVLRSPKGDMIYKIFTLIKLFIDPIPSVTPLAYSCSFWICNLPALARS